MPPWKTVKLGDVIKINEKSIGKDFQFSKIEYLDTSSVTENRFEKPELLRLIDSPSRAKRIVRKGDTLISTVRPNLKHFGYVNTSKSNTIASTGFAVLTPSNIDPYFLFCFISQDSITTYLSSIADSSTTTFPAFNPKIIENLELLLPDLSTQSRIASILSAFDDKIELNRQMNNTLEQMAQAMFKEYFLDYEKGTIQLADYIILNPKISIPKNSIVKYVEMSDLPVSGSSIIHFIDRPFNSGSKFQINDTLLARITPCLENGKTGFVDFMQEKETGFGSTEFIVMRSKKDISPYYVYFIARDNSFREHAIRSMVGTSGRQRVQTEMLNDYMLKEIDPEEMKKFHLFSESCFSKIKNNCNENKFLVQLRESLLPKLMSGEISTDSLPLIESRETIIA